MPQRSVPFEPDPWWDEDYDDDGWARRSAVLAPSFRQLHPDFDSGASHPELIYPADCPCGDQCKGHPRPEGVYSEEYLWAFTRTPTINFLGGSDVVPVREEYL